jgi:hypothetical protein
MQLVLVAGAQRSGTTLLQTLLANALGSPLLPEAHILCDILLSYKRARSHLQKTQFFYPTEDDLLDFFRTFALRHLEDISSRTASPSVLVLKDPNFVQVLDELSAIFPDCVRIVCVRDPRDIAASFLQIGKRQSNRDRLSPYGKRDIRFIAKKILSSYARLLECPQPENIVLVHYEQLATDPNAVLERVSRDTGLKFSYSQIDTPVWLAADARHDPAWISDIEGQKPNPASVGAFRSVMERAEIKKIQRLCEPLMRQFDYEPVRFEQHRPTFSARVLYRLKRIAFRASKSPKKAKMDRD